MLKIQNTLFILTSLLYLVSIWTVFATANISGFSSLLINMTQENGFFEISLITNKIQKILEDKIDKFGDGHPTISKNKIINGSRYILVNYFQ